ncbi:MAG: hypothetical protein RIR09_1543 [Pseudomonadota bacterium]|jgi:hypothetical protein
MGYDYSSGSKTFDVANPYKLQNRLMFIAAAGLLIAGALSLWQTRGLLQLSAGAGVIAPLLSAVGLLFVGLWLAAAAASRLRFFFGRGRPLSLAPELANGTFGSSRHAEEVKEIMRHGALTYPEPKGALEGLLYDRIPHLITAPLALQHQAKAHFFNLVALTATLLSFVFAWGFFGDPASRPWVSLIYGVFGTFFLLRPVNNDNTAPIGTASIVFLILAAVLAPVVLTIIGPKLPSLGTFSVHWQVIALLLGSLVVVLLAFVSTLAQVAEPPQTRTSAEVSRVNLQAPPASLIDELDRAMQEQWTERIPNRRYSWIEPQTPLDKKSGSFSGEMMEESQPVPRAGMVVESFQSALATPLHRWLVVSDLICTALLIAGAGMVLAFTSAFNVQEPAAGSALSFLGSALIWAIVARFGLRNAALLWGRFDFTSELTWVEMQGTYQISRIGTGNQFNSQIQTESEIVRVESMTLRVWRARLESVVFGKDNVRQITALFSTDAEARSLLQRLVQFGQGQSVIAAPQAAEDHRRLTQIGQGSQVLAALSGNTDMSAAQLLGQSTAQITALPASTKFCIGCGVKIPTDARFCAECGAAQ